MFENIGKKIKALAQVTCWLGIIGSIIYGLSLLEDEALLGLLVMAGGSLVAWISNLALYGFGELIDTTVDMNSNLCDLYNLLATSDSDEEDVPVSVGNENRSPLYSTTSNDGWTCKKCNTVNAGNAQYCKDCGSYK